MTSFWNSAEAVAQVGTSNGDENAKQFLGRCRLNLLLQLNFKKMSSEPLEVNWNHDYMAYYIIIWHIILLYGVLYYYIAYYIII